MLNHYFKRKGVAVKKNKDIGIQEKQHGNIYAEFEKIKTENRSLKQSHEDLHARFADMEKAIIKKSLGEVVSL